MKINVRLIFFILTESSISVIAEIHGATDFFLQNKQNYIKNSSNHRTELNNSTDSPAHSDARRNQPSFSSPGNINDPEFQGLLNHYRGMVQRYSRSESQQENDRFQPAFLGRSTNAYDFSNKVWVTTQNPNNALQSGDGYFVVPQKYKGMINIPEQYKFKWTTTRPVLRETMGIREQYTPWLIKGHYPKWAAENTKQGPRNGPGMMPGFGPNLQGAAGPPGQMPGGQMPGGQRPEGQMPIGQGSNGEVPEGQIHNNHLEGITGNPEDMTMPGYDNKAAEAASRFTTRTTTTKRRRRTTPPRVSFEEDCDYIAYYCLKAYDTGQVCGRTMYHIYSTFQNYCMMDFVNCMERYEIWQIVHMGECFELKVLSEYLHYPYKDDYFLDQYYVIEDM